MKNIKQKRKFSILEFDGGYFEALAEREYLIRHIIRLMSL
jgi:hypothetical protein